MVGGYEVLDLIARGPSGSVVRSRDLMGQPRILKRLHRALCDRAAIERLWSDLQAMSAARVVGAVEVYDGGWTNDGSFFIVSEPLGGTDLDQVLSQRETLREEEALGLVVDLCDVLAPVHAAGVVHGNLKPTNVLLCPDAAGHLAVRLCDFGIRHLWSARALSAGEEARGTLHPSDPYYLAPEQFRGECSPASDIYSAGIMLYEMLTGTVPFRGRSYASVMLRHLSDKAALPDGLTQEVALLVERALAKAPEDRFRSVTELRRAILALPPAGAPSERRGHGESRRPGSGSGDGRGRASLAAQARPGAPERSDAVAGTPAQGSSASAAARSGSRGAVSERPSGKESRGRGATTAPSKRAAKAKAPPSSSRAGRRTPVANTSSASGSRAGTPPSAEHSVVDFINRVNATLPATAIVSGSWRAVGRGPSRGATLRLYGWLLLAFLVGAGGVLGLLRLPSSEGLVSRVRRALIPLANTVDEGARRGTGGDTPIPGGAATGTDSAGGREPSGIRVQPLPR
jgi:serine/threonine-protein kinase